MRLVATVALALVAVVLIVPVWFGRAAEGYLDAFVDELEPGGPVRITGHEHERGWYASSGSISADVGGLESDLSYRYRLFHGPVILRNGIRPGQARFEGVLTLNGRGANRTRFTGMLDLEFDLTAKLIGVLVSESGRIDNGFEVIELGGTDLGYRVDYVEPALDASVRVDRALVETGALRVRLDNTRVTVNGGAGAGWHGDLGAGRMIIDGGSERLEAGDIQTRFASTPGDGAVDIDIRARFDNGAPGGGSVDARLTGLIEPHFSNLVAKAALLGGDQPAGYYALLPEVFAMINSGRTRLTVRSSIDTGPSPTLVEIDASLDAPKQASFNPLAVLDAINATGRMRMPEAVLDRLIGLSGRHNGSEPDPEAVKSRYIRSGLIVIEDGRVGVDASVRGGQLMLNGRTWALNVGSG